MKVSSHCNIKHLNEIYNFCEVSAVHMWLVQLVEYTRRSYLPVISEESKSKSFITISLYETGMTVNARKVSKTEFRFLLSYIYSLQTGCCLQVAWCFKGFDPHVSYEMLLTTACFSLQ